MKATLKWSARDGGAWYVLVNGHSTDRKTSLLAAAKQVAAINSREQRNDAIIRRYKLNNQRGI